MKLGKWLKDGFLQWQAKVIENQFSQLPFLENTQGKTGIE